MDGELIRRERNIHRAKKEEVLKMTKMTDMAADAIDRKAEKEKKKLKKKVRKTVHRIIRGILWTGFVLCCGLFIGIHRNVIKAWLKGEELPKVPAGHWHHCR